MNLVQNTHGRLTVDAVRHGIEQSTLTGWMRVGNTIQPVTPRGGKSISAKPIPVPAGPLHISKFMTLMSEL